MEGAGGRGWEEGEGEELPYYFFCCRGVHVREAVVGTAAVQLLVYGLLSVAVVGWVAWGGPSLAGPATLLLLLFAVPLGTALGAVAGISRLSHKLLYPQLAYLISSIAAAALSMLVSIFVVIYDMQSGKRFFRALAQRSQTNDVVEDSRYKSGEGRYSELEGIVNRSGNLNTVGVLALVLVLHALVGGAHYGALKVTRAAFRFLHYRHRLCHSAQVGLCGAGLAGNWLSVWVFSRKSMRVSSINVLLTGLSLTDFLLLLVVVPIFALPALSAESGASSPALDDFIHYMIAYVYPVAVILQTASVWIFLLITVERWLAVCEPLRVAHICTVGRSRAALLAVYVAAVGYNVVRFWEYSVEPCPDAFCGSVLAVPALRNSRPYWLWYGTVAYLLTQFLLPFLLIALLNGMIVVRMYEARRQRALLSSTEKSEHRTAVMMIMVVVVFGACYSLSFVLNFHEALDPELFYRDSTSALAYLLNDVSNTLVVLNSASTFIVYLSFSRRYRHIARLALLRCLPGPVLRSCLSQESLAQLNRKSAHTFHSVMPKASGPSAPSRLTTPGVGAGRAQAASDAGSPAHFRLLTTSQESLLSPADGQRLPGRHRYLVSQPRPALRAMRSASRSCDDLLSPPSDRHGPASPTPLLSPHQPSTVLIANGACTRAQLPPTASPEPSLLSPSPASPPFQEHAF